MKQIQVKFATGKELLASYWGFLANGGLVLHEQLDDLAQGEGVELEVTIESAQQSYQLRGRVVHTRRGAATHEHAVVAFDPGEPQDFLLSAAWSDVDNVPTRRHRRFPVDGGVRVRSGDGEVLGRLVNVSHGGCCVRVLPAPDELGFTVGGDAFVAGEHEIACVVRWTCAADMGLEFKDPETQVVRRFVEKLL